MTTLGTATILRADARQLPLADASVDAIVCDPPYSLSFMGRSWDRFDEPRAFQAWCLVWAREAYRVLKPGGYLLAFGGTRTYHRLTCAIEDAGFEIRDSIGHGHMAWTYGQGFAKGINVSKAIDAAGGVSPADQAAVLRAARERAALTREQVAAAVGCTPASVRDWEEGRARAADRPVEHITPSPEYRDKLADLLGYTADERRIVGARTDRRGDGSVIGLGHSGVEYADANTQEARRWQGWNTSLKPAWEPIVVARKPLIGTVVDNVLQLGTGALNIDGCRIPAGQDYADKCASVVGLASNRNGDAYGEWTGTRTDSHPAGRWPTNVVLSHVPKLDEHGEIVGDACADGCVADCPVAELDTQTGTLKSGANPTRRGSPKFADAYGEFVGRAECVPARGADEGGASRFFPTFRYEAKAPSSERPRVNDITHNTVKPLELIRFLCRLSTRPGGLILDMFGGSGTTAEAALLEGFNVVVSESWAPYLPLIQYRIDRARRRLQPGVARLGKAKPSAQTDGQGDLLADLFGGAA